MATGLALTVALVATIVGGIVVGVLALLVRHSGTLRGVDASAANWGNDHSTHLSSQLLQHVTDLGDWPLVPLIAIVVADRRAVAQAELVPDPVRPRRHARRSGRHERDQGVHGPRAPDPEPRSRRRSGPSFPSGHSSTAAAFYAALALILSRGRPPRACAQP